MKIRYIVSFLFFFSFSFLFSRNDFQFRHFTVEDGLPSNSVRAIVQDKTGFIWIGTDEGLVRYDGKRVKTFRDNSLDNSVVEIGSVMSLLDVEDNLWIGTDKGVYIYNYIKTSFSFFSIKTTNGVSIETTVNNVVIDKNENLWFSTYGQGIFRYNLATDELLQYDFQQTSGVVQAVYVDSKQKVWAISSQENKILFFLDNIDNQFKPFSLYRKGSEEFVPKSLTMYEDSFGRFFLGTWDEGLLEVNKQSGQVKSFLEPMVDGVLHIHSILEYKPGLLLIGSDDGLSLFDLRSKTHILYTYDETSSKSLSNQFVYPIIRDHEGGLWIGTYYGGVNYVSPQSSLFQNYINSKFYNSVAGNIIGRFCEDKDNNIWIATDDGGLSCFFPDEERFENYIAQEKGLSYHNVHALCMDDDELWIGTYTGGLNILNIKTGKFRYYTSDPNDPKTLDGSSIYAIYKDDEGNIWVGTMTGINRYNRETDDFDRIRSLDVLIIDILEDDKGNIWFATQGKGVFRYNKRDNLWINYNVKGSSKFLASNHANCLYLDSENKLLVGTFDGLCVYNEEQDNFDKIVLEGVLSNNICGITEFDNDFWLTTSKGLVCYSKGKVKEVFTSKDGLQSDFFVSNSILKSSRGSIFAGSIKGFCVFNPKEVMLNTIVPPVVITGLEIYNKEINVNEGTLTKAIEFSNFVELSYKQSFLNFKFSSLSYCAPDKNEFAYMLEGYDKDWIYVTAEGKATYTKLPAGKYIFKVKGSNNNKLWNEEETSLHLVITPPFYLTLSFKVLYLVLFLILLVFFIWFLVQKKEKKHKEEIQEIKEEQERESYQSKINFFTMIAHEIRTPVSLIVGPLEEILNSSYPLPEWILSSLNIMSKNTNRILDLINQLLDFRKIEEKGEQYELKGYSITSILKEVTSRFLSAAKEKGLDFIVEYSSEDVITEVDRDAFIKAISNLLTNAFKYAASKVIVRLQIDLNKNSYSISVLDDGPGVNVDEQELIFEPFYQASGHKTGTGVGLSIVKRIVAGHNGIITIKEKSGDLTHFYLEFPIITSEGLKSSTKEDTNNKDLKCLNIDNKDSLNESESKKKHTILIVDDDVDMLSFLSQGLLRRDYNVITAHDGEEALMKLKKNTIDFIISDLMMPKMDGFELCNNIRSNSLYSHLPFVLLTAKTETSSKIEGLECGADAYLDKPFAFTHLEAVIKNIFSLRGLLQEQYSKMPLVSLNTVTSNPDDKAFLDKLNFIIEENFSNPDLNVDFLAKSLYVSRSGLFAKIKALVDVTPNELIQIVRLKKAASLLLLNQYKVNEICYMVGFNNPSYFSKCFQKQFGVLPRDFIEASTR